MNLSILFSVILFALALYTYYTLYQVKLSLLHGQVVGSGFVDFPAWPPGTSVLSTGGPGQCLDARAVEIPVTFPAELPAVPSSVLVSIVAINGSQPVDLRLRLSVKNITTKGCTVVAGTWCDSLIYTLKVQYLVIS